MKITFHKVSDEQHRIHVRRADRSEDSALLNSREFLRHDLAHYAVERELGLRRGFWGSVAAGSALTGAKLSGPDIERAESLAGPVQILMREQASRDDFIELLTRLDPATVDHQLAGNVHERCRQLLGNWRGTPFGGEMQMEWPGYLA